MEDLIESSDDEETKHEPATSTQNPPVNEELKHEPESKRQRIQWLENVIDKVLGGFSSSDKILCDREKFKAMLSDLDEQWTGTWSRQTRRIKRKTRQACNQSNDQVMVAEVYSPRRMFKMADKLNMKS